MNLRAVRGLEPRAAFGAFVYSVLCARALLREPRIELPTRVRGIAAARIMIDQRCVGVVAEARPHCACVRMRREQDVAGQGGDRSDAVAERRSDTRMLRLVRITVHVIR